MRCSRHVVCVSHTDVRQALLVMLYEQLQVNLAGSIRDLKFGPRTSAPVTLCVLHWSDFVAFVASLMDRRYPTVPMGTTRGGVGGLWSSVSGSHGRKRRCRGSRTGCLADICQDASFRS